MLAKVNQHPMQDGWCVDRKNFFIIVLDLITNHNG